jgi:hypothetical protein
LAQGGVVRGHQGEGDCNKKAEFQKCLLRVVLPCEISHRSLITIGLRSHSLIPPEYDKDKRAAAPVKPAALLSTHYQGGQQVTVAALGRERNFFVIRIGSLSASRSLSRQ